MINTMISLHILVLFVLRATLERRLTLYREPLLGARVGAGRGRGVGVVPKRRSGATRPSLPGTTRVEPSAPLTALPTILARDRWPHTVGGKRVPLVAQVLACPHRRCQTIAPALPPRRAHRVSTAAPRRLRRRLRRLGAGN